MGLYRPTVTRSDKHGRKTRKKSSVWWGSFRDPRTGESVRISLKTQDRKSAQLALSDAIHRAHQESAGLVNPFEKELSRPLADHIEDWHAALRGKGNAPKHAGLLKTRATAIVNGCRFIAWSDISASRVQGFLKTLRDGGKSAQTANFYLQAIKQFAKWMVADRRAPESPIAHLSGFNTRTDRRHDRRSLTADELRSLLTVTRTQPRRYGLDGPVRTILYQLVCETGLRAEECRTLTPVSFRFDSDQPMVTVGAAYTKNRQTCELPLRLATAKTVTELVRELGDDVHPFRFWKDRGARMLKADLEAAGIAYVDSAGRYADFHALRHTFVTNLASGGVHPKDAQILARHSTIGLTMDRYTHRAVGDVANAPSVLPDLSDRGPDRDSMRATGTYDVDEIETGCCTSVVQTGHFGGSRAESADVGRSGNDGDSPRVGSCAKVLPSQSVTCGAGRTVSPTDGHNATVAQLAEQRFCKPQVAGSSPTGGCSVSPAFSSTSSSIARSCARLS